MNDTSKMSKGYVNINGKSFPVSIAIDESEQMNGLMHVEPPLTSMAFIYPIPQANRFWMKNVKADLDIIFCYKGKITEIIRADAMSTRLVGKGHFSDLVIELPVEIGDKYDFDIGDDVKMSLSKEAFKKILG